MRVLFDIDTHDYDTNGKRLIRPSARSIIIRNGTILMVHSVLYDYYKFPGGGFEENESVSQALARETLEEAGVSIVPGSEREYGIVHRIQSGHGADIFEQDNYYFFVDIDENSSGQDLDEYEQEEHFTPVWIDPEAALTANSKPDHGPKDPVMIDRETRVLKMLIDEGYFSPNRQ